VRFARCVDVVSAHEIELAVRPHRNTDNLAGTVVTSLPSRTFIGLMLAATMRRPLGSKANVRTWNECVSAC
jgi:hypothetical protein